MNTEHISETVKKITLANGSVITLVGTAHVSSNSVKEVEKAIEEQKPDRVCLELDQGRMDSKNKKNSYENMDLKKVFKEGKAFLVLANTVLASFQKKMGNQLGGINPGEEILTAGKIASEQYIPVSLCDREITITFKRAWRNSNFFNKAKLIGLLISSAFDKEEFTPEELEELKKNDNIQNMMEELAKELPKAKTALIDERDRFLATSIYCCEGKNKLAVVGAGHMNGIIKTFEKIENNEISKDLSEISSVPAPSALNKMLSFVIPAAIIGLVVYKCITNGIATGLTELAKWAGSNALCTFIFTLLCLGHPITALAGALCAPISVLSPFIAVGVFTAITECEVRKPKVHDYENLAEDVGKIRGWFKNRFLHAFLVFFSSSIGSILGTFVLYPIIRNLF